MTPVAPEACREFFGFPTLETIGNAQAIADRLVALRPDLEAIFLCGSVARGDAGLWSDIDLIAIGSRDDLTAEDLRNLLQIDRERASIVYYPAPEFRMLLETGALFMAHVRKESVVLFDRAGIHEALKSHSLSRDNIREQIQLQISKLDLYLDPKRFNNNFLFCLSHLYSIGKSVVMLGLANRGFLEFNRDIAFDRFTALHPDLLPEVEKVTRLRPFYRLAAGRDPEPLPFSYNSASRETAEALWAIRTLAQRAERS